jgi:hypothetical protein
LIDVLAVGAVVVALLVVQQGMQQVLEQLPQPEQMQGQAENFKAICSIAARWWCACLAAQGGPGCCQ